MDKTKLQILVGILLLGLGLGIYEFYDFYSEEAPLLEQERQKLDQQLGAKQTELRKLQEFAQNLESIKQELRELSLQLESALEHMPRTFNLSGLLRKLTMLAQNSGLELSTFKPQVKEDKEQGQFYSSVVINFDLRGTFTQTLLFFDQVSRLKRIVNLEAVKMSVPGGSQVRHSGAVVVTSMASIRTYRFAE